MNNRSLVEVVAETESFVAILPRNSVNEIIARQPELIYIMGERLLAALPGLIKLADFALEWKQFRAGQTICHESKSWYVF